MGGTLFERYCSDRADHAKVWESGTRQKRRSELLKTTHVRDVADTMLEAP